MILATLTAMNLSFGGEWLDKASERADPEAIEWVKQKLKEDEQLNQLRSFESLDFSIGSKKCLTSAAIAQPDSEIPIYVLISFSVPKETWVALSKEMESMGAVFVLRGLPSNSFRELASLILDLKNAGVKAAIQINPNLFTDYQIDEVPAFLAIKGKEFRKIRGNISLNCAIEKMGGLDK